MPPRDRRDLADLLLRKAAADGEIVNTLIESAAPYEAAGFHAQQSCEKSLKAVLAAGEVAYPHTHNLAVLVDLLRAVPIAVPDVVEQAVVLTPFAVLYRYDDFELDEEPIALDAMRTMVAEVQGWAAAKVHPLAGS